MLGKFKKNVNYIALNLSIPIGLFTFFFPDRVVMSLWGSGWINGIEILKYLSLYIILFPMFHALKTRMYALHGKSLLVGSIYIVGLIIQIILLFMIDMYDFETFSISVVFTLSLLVMYLCLIFLNLKQ